MYNRTNKKGSLAVLVVSAVLFAFAIPNVSAQFYPSGMVGYWKFDETSGTTAHDALNINDGVLMNINGLQWTEGQVDGGLKFDGANGSCVLIESELVNLVVA